MANEEHLALLMKGVEVWNEWRKTNRKIKPDLSRAILRRANLGGANLGGANLSGANLNGANLHRADLRSANLSRTILSGAILSGAILSEANLSEAILSRTILSGAKLSSAILSGAILSSADLSYTDLSEANLARTQALKSNFEGATFTGACIEDWNINSQTNLNNVICDYVYQKEAYPERRPHDFNKNFEPGEFTKLYQEVENTAELIFRHGINWKAFAYAFCEENIQVYNTDGGELFLREYKALEDGLIVLKVSIPPGIDKDQVREKLIHKYELQIASLEGELKAKNEMLAPLYERLLLPGTQINHTIDKESEMFEREKILILQKIDKKGSIRDSQIANDLNLDIHKVRVILNQLKESKFIESIEHKQSYDPNLPKIDFVLVTEITSNGRLALQGEIPLSTNMNSNSVININSGNFGIGHMSGGEIKDNAKVAATINEAQQKNIAEAATEIQQLLEQLSNNHPISTNKEKIIVVAEAVDQIESNPTLKTKVINALKAGGIETFKEAINHPLVSILVATIEGWQEAE